MDDLFLLLRVIASLAVVLGLLWSVQKYLTRRVGGGREDAISVVARRGLTNKASVVMVDIKGEGEPGDTRFVLAVTEQAVTVLQSAPAPERVTEPVSQGEASFARMLASARKTVPSPSTAVATARTVAFTEGTTGRLAGSVFSAATWKQAAAALRQGPTR